MTSDDTVPDVVTVRGLGGIRAVLESLQRERDQRAWEQAQRRAAEARRVIWETVLRDHLPAGDERVEFEKIIAEDRARFPDL